MSLICKAMPTIKTPCGSSDGFALVASLLLLTLLVGLVLAVMALMRVETGAAGNQVEMAQARQNALTGLQIAMGELQEAMGPDRRISARAGLIASDPRVAASVPDDTPKSWWVGVVGSKLEDDSGSPYYGLDAENPVSATNPAAVWLVSGLDPGLDPKQQIEAAVPFADPVIMLDEGSIDTDALTGGEPIIAGLVKVDDPGGTRVHGYAYWIDDEALKATLAPQDSDLVNANHPASTHMQTPGVFDLSVLDGMTSVPNSDVSVFSSLFSMRDLPLLGSDNTLPNLKRFSYTASSLGVLCDVKNGGLKRDLTVAFEDDATFNEVFPRGTGDYTADYLCIDPDKLSEPSLAELRENGYIHWEIFKDHYNIKRHIKTYSTSDPGIVSPDPNLNDTKYLDPVRYSKAGVLMQNNGFAPGGWAVNKNGDPAGGPAGSLFMAGRLGPHEIGDDETSQYPEMEGMVYGDYAVEPNNPDRPKNHEQFKHSPVIPILQRLQANAWIEKIGPITDVRSIRTHAQMWSSHYNPYNIALYVAGKSGGPRILGTPQITGHDSPRRRFYKKKADGTYELNGSGNKKETFLDREGFTNNQLQFHSKNPVMLLPGRSHVMAYEASAHVDDSENGFLYNDEVENLTVESVFRELECVEDLPGSLNFEIRMSLLFASLHHGVDDNKGGPGNFEVHQSFWAPFAWDRTGGFNPRPGKVFNFGSVSFSDLNDNNMARLGFNLRTTRESGSSIRPLVDANIRSLFGNTRWDSPLGVEVLAAYTPENDGEMSQMIMDMDVSDDPKGYSYWGAGRDSFGGYDRVILFDIPRADLVSPGQLQHAGAGRFSYEPTYIVGNSYANPRISQENWKESVQDTFSTAARGLDIFQINGNFNLYDASYLVNEILWDQYVFTTIPQVADNVSSLSVTEPAPDDAHFTALNGGSAKLPNARYLPYAPTGSSFDRTTLQMASDKDDETGAFYHNAGHLLIDGAFNVNSTSVDAWEAFLSSTHSLPFEKLDEDGRVVNFDTSVDSVRFPRVQHVFGDGVKKDDLDNPTTDTGFWTGFRELEQSEVRSLAQAIVDEIKLRGPFLSMADFVNRKLEAGALGESGALQAALDQTVNAGVDSDFTTGNQGAGFPGQLLQGDILQALAPYMNVRSDTFTIRAYGQTREAGTDGKILARAWCEATVQRYPDPMEWTGSGTPLENLTNPPSPFGRQFKIVSFRWLTGDEI